MGLVFDEQFLRQLERLSVLSKRATVGDSQGNQHSAKRGTSVEFADYRNYAHGDDFRQVDWNVYARLERYFIKLFVEDTDLTVHLLIDTSRSMDWGTPTKLSYAQHAAAALGYIALAGYDRVTVSAFSSGITQTLTPRRGKRQSVTLFQFLSDLSHDGSTDLASTLQQYVAQAGQPGPLLLMSDLFDNTWQESLRILQTRPFEITLLHILSADEVTPSVEGDLRLIDSESGRHIEVTADFELHRRYRESFERWIDEIRRFCDRRGINYVQVDTSVPFEKLIFMYLQQRRILG